MSVDLLVWSVRACARRYMCARVRLCVCVRARACVCDVGVRVWGGGSVCVHACVPTYVRARVMYVGVLFCNNSPVYVTGLIFICFGPK